MDRDDPAYAGQRDYNRLLLRAYDPLVLGPIATLVWRCPASGLVERYRRSIRDPHLDVGPGTGYFLEHAGLPPGSRVTILDPNSNVLRHVSRRLRNLDISAIEADVLKPLPVAGTFESAALHLVLHCLPGPLERKARAVANVAGVLAPDGVLFGASVLGRGGRHTWAARRMLAAFNREGGFDNLADTEDGLREILEASFERVDIDIVGSVALFAATRPRPPTTAPGEASSQPGPG
ncbi:MAG TPA: class I SAM-dependent methyltransferase [Candidatus Limnocylindrales bacterium]|jgi:SAM-dependent methyltransferase